MLQDQFKVYAPLEKSLTPKTLEKEDDALFIEGVASTTSKDLQGDSVLPSAIKSMKEQALNVNLYGDHEAKLFSGIIGVVTEVLDSTDSEFRIKARVLPKYADELREMLENGVRLGLSVGGKTTKYSRDNKGRLQVKDVKLEEISLTGVPANLDTLGVSIADNGIIKSRCVEGACKQILKSMESENMADEDPKKENETTSEPLTEEQAIDLFNEMMAEKQEEIVKSTVEQVEKQLETLIDEKLEEFKPAEDEKEPETEAEEEEEEKTTKKSSKPAEDEEEVEEEEDDEEKIEKAVNKYLGTFFDDLNNNRKPTPEIKKSLNASTPENNEGMTPVDIAKAMYGGKNRNNFISNLLR